MALSPKVKVTFDADLSDLKRGTAQAEDEVSGFSKTVDKFGAAAKAAFAAAAAAAAAYAVKLGVDAVKAASDFSETQSKINVIFGDSAKKLSAFASTAATALGQTKTQALDAAATFAIFGKSAGLSGDALVSFSTDFVKLASDLASFNNTSPEDAIQAIGAALRGEAEPLRRYGVLLDDATLKAKAMEMGIYSGTGSLTAQQKVLAAQQVIMAQTTLAQGDFARTSDGLANTQRILAAQFENTKIVLGEKLLPIVLDTIKFFQNSLPTAIKILQNAFQPITDAIARNKESFQALGKIIMDYVVPVIGVSFVAALNVVGKVAGGIIDIIGKVAGAISTVVNGAISAINVLINAYNKIPLLPNIPTIPKTSVPSISIPKISTSTPSVSVPTITAPTTTGGGSTGATGAASTIAKTATATPTISSGSVAYPQYSGVNTTTLAGIAAASKITINVNAPSVIDEAGFSTAVINALNNGTYRGTAGGGMLAGLAI